MNSGDISTSAEGDGDCGLFHRPSLPVRFEFPDALADDLGFPVQKRRSANTSELRKLFRRSAPVSIPAWPRGMRRPAEDLAEVNDGEEEAEAEEEMLPPHVIVARSQMMTFSVFEGRGRTLKGRDLRRVRNAVFQSTGFLD